MNIFSGILGGFFVAFVRFVVRIAVLFTFFSIFVLVGSGKYKPDTSPLWFLDPISQEGLIVG